MSTPSRGPAATMRPSRTTTTASATGGASGLTRVAPTMASGSAPVVVAAFDAPVAPDAATARHIVMVARIMRSSSVSRHPVGKVLPHRLPLPEREAPPHRFAEILDTWTAERKSVGGGQGV